MNYTPRYAVVPATYKVYKDVTNILFNSTGFDNI